MEIERRFLLQRPPASLIEQTNSIQIIDRYFDGTRLRLRHMTMPSGEQIYKLTQKFQSLKQHAAETTITNLYLDEAEVRLLRQLNGRELVKKRYPFLFEGKKFSIDIFEGELAGLVLVEIECASLKAAEALKVPSFAAEEVTADPFFRGGHLVNLTQQELQQALRQRKRENECSSY